jgi:hypothetical protein
MKATEAMVAWMPIYMPATDQTPGAIKVGPGWTEQAGRTATPSLRARLNPVGTMPARMH